MYNNEGKIITFNDWNKESLDKIFKNLSGLSKQLYR